MILEQLVQTARRFCECRPGNYLPQDDLLHTALAYCVNDRLEARKFDGRQEPIPQSVKAWLDDCQAIAYALISLRSRTSQPEFPPPIGRELRPLLSISAATDEDQLHLGFRIHPAPSGDAYRLVPDDSPFETVPFARQNFFLLGQNQEQEAEEFPTASQLEHTDALLA